MNYSKSRRRRRAYERRFDWKLARSMHSAGETLAAIARVLGVDRRGVARVVKLPQHVVDAEMTEEEVAALVLAFPRDRIPCPRCGGPMVPKASLCRDCTNELRLLPMTLERVPGSNGLVELRNVEVQRIIETQDGRAGVVCSTPKGSPYGYRVVDYWHEGPELTNDRIRVRVLPSTEVLVGGVRDGGEEIEE